MLTIPEEFLLLTLKDQDGGFIHINQEYLHAGFVGAAIMELSLQGKLDSDLKRIWAVDKSPTGDALLDAVLNRIVTPGFDSTADNIVDQLIDLGPSLRSEALRKLCEKKVLTETEGKLLWILKTRRYPLVDGKEIREVKLRILEVLLRDGLPEPRDVCIMSLAETCGIIEQIVPHADLASCREKIAKFTKMELIGQNVNHFIELYEFTKATMISPPI